QDPGRPDGPGPGSPRSKRRGTLVSLRYAGHCQGAARPASRPVGPSFLISITSSGSGRTLVSDGATYAGMARSRQPRTDFTQARCYSTRPSVGSSPWPNRPGTNGNQTLLGE